MNARSLKLASALVTLAFSILDPQLSTVLAQGTAFTYQGRLNDANAPANGSYDLRFIVYDNSVGGIQQGPSLTNAATAVSNGLFTVTLDFGNQFPGAARWLDIAVRTNGGGNFSALAPRQPLTSSPYAITAGNVVSGGLAAGAYGNAVTLNNAANQFTGSFAGNGANVTNVNAATLGGLAPSNFWQLGGNSISLGQFLGSVNNQPMAILANNLQVMRFAYASNSVDGYSPNLIGGNSANNVSAGVVGATIGGGGGSGIFLNSVTADFGTVVGGSFSSANGKYAVAGGFNSSANADYSVAMGNSSAGGQYSAAFGYSSATNSYSSAMGYSFADGFVSTAMGHSVAAGQYSAAFGNSSANDDYATAMGSSTAGGTNSTALGASSTSANYATAMGYSFAYGAYSTAMGTGLATNVAATAMGVSTAGGYGSTAMGSCNRFAGLGAYGDYSTAMGASLASGFFSTAMGGSSASYYAATAVGNSYAGGRFSTAMGASTNSADYSTAMGQSIANGGFSTAMGASEADGGYSTAMGYFSIASGSNSTAMGSSDAGGDYSTAMGGSTAGGAFSTAVCSSLAGGDYSFGGGYGASAGYNGDFVWADSQFTGTFFASTAPNQFLIRAAGGVGIDTTAPQTALHVADASGITLGQSATGGGYTALRIDLSAVSGGYAELQAISSSGSSYGNLILNRFGNNVGIATGANTPGHLLVVGSSGFPAYCDGVNWVNGSDRNSKQDFSPVNPLAVLEKVAALPITEWQYKTEPGQEHLGPMAQDFHAAFGLNGSDDKHISTVDEGGVALAAIQGLNQKVNELQTELNRRDAENAELKARLDKLERMLLNQKSN